MNDTTQLARADALEADAAAIRRVVAAERDTAMRARPIEERLVYAAYNRCPCGYGLAYDQPASMHGSWSCAGVLLGTADRAVPHRQNLSFAYHEIKSDNQPSAEGRTTRGTVVPQVVS